MVDREALEVELEGLRAANASATSWGAAVGARSERIKGIESTLRRMDEASAPAPSAGSPASAVTDLVASIRQAESMLSAHIEEFHDFDYPAHAIPTELQQLRDIQHHLLGSLIDENGEIYDYQAQSPPPTGADNISPEPNALREKIATTMAQAFIVPADYDEDGAEIYSSRDWQSALETADTIVAAISRPSRTTAMTISAEPVACETCHALLKEGDGIFTTKTGFVHFPHCPPSPDAVRDAAIARCVEELQHLRTRQYDIGTVDAAIRKLQALAPPRNDDQSGSTRS